MKIMAWPGHGPIFTLDLQTFLTWKKNSRGTVRIYDNFSLGIVRIWNKEGHLTEIYYWNEAYKSTAWRIDSEYLIFKNISFVRNDHRSLIVPFNVSQNIYIGTYNDVLHVANNIYIASVTITNSEKECILQVSWNTEQEIKDVFLDFTNKEFISQIR